MKTFKMLCLVIGGAMGLMALGGTSTASATALYSGGTKLVAGSELKTSLTETTKFEATSGTVLNTCTGGVASGKIANAGGSSSTVSGKIENLTWTGCTNPMTTLEGCGFEWHWITGTLNATVTWNNCRVTTTGIVGTICVYSAGTATHLGTFKGATAAGHIAEVVVTALLAALLSESSPFCPSEVRWTGTYEVTSPIPIHATGS